MDVCHMLLGRPWQYDKKAIHDGRKNTYTITSNGKRITLTPLEDESESEVCGIARINLVDGRKFLDGLRHKNMCFALIPRKYRALDVEIITAREGEPLEKEVTELLTKYQALVSENVPNGLQPI